MPAPTDSITYDFTLLQGETWELYVTVMDPDTPASALDLTGYAVRCQFRVKPGASTLIEEPLAAVSNAASGIISLSLTAAETAAINHPHFYYDVEVESPAGRVIRVLMGHVTLDREVTES
jgi:hypothetical protein